MQVLKHARAHTHIHTITHKQVQELKAERDSLRKEVSTMQADTAKREKKLKMELERVRQQLEDATQRNAELVRELKFSEEARLAQVCICICVLCVCMVFVYAMLLEESVYNCTSKVALPQIDMNHVHTYTHIYTNVACIARVSETLKQASLFAESTTGNK
jgi:hypothetical protein